MIRLAILIYFTFLNSHDLSAQWIKYPNTDKIDHIASFLYSKGKLVVSSESSGQTFQLMDNSNEWTVVIDKSGYSFSHEIIQTDSLFWISTQTGFLYSKTNDPNWHLYGDTITVGKYYLATSMAVLQPKEKGLPYRLFSGTLGIGLHKSIDGGFSWTEIDSAEFHSNDQLDMKTYVNSNAETEFFMITLKGVYESNNEGNSWIRSDTISAIQHARKLWHLNKDWFLLADDGLYKREINIGKWVKTSPQFTNGFLIYDIISIDSVLFAGTFQGIFKSLDNGETWELASPFSEALNESGTISFIVFTQKQNSLLAATQGKGIWGINTSDLTTTNIENNEIKPTVTKLYPNYPNPFNPETTISFENAEKGIISVSIYNIQGQLVRELTNQEYSRGYHSLNWNGKNSNGLSVSSGVYLLQLKSGKSVQYFKMLMIK